MYPAVAKSAHEWVNKLSTEEKKAVLVEIVHSLQRSTTNMQAIPITASTGEELATITFSNPFRTLAERVEALAVEQRQVPSEVLSTLEDSTDMDAFLDRQQAAMGFSQRG